jgi:hypothetical protein
MRTTSMLIVSIAILAGAAPARAGELNMWSSVAAGCVPGDPAIQGNRYTIVAGSAGLRTTATGPVTLYCPIAKMGTSFMELYFVNLEGALVLAMPTFRESCLADSYVLGMTYTDGDGTGTGVNVTAELVGLSKTTGLLSSTGARIDSNQSSRTTPGTLAVSFTNPIDTDGYYYYVRVDLSRASGNTAPATFYGVALDCGSPTR